MLDEENHKNRILQLYKDKWNVGVKNKDLSIKKLENVLSTKVTKRQQKRAVIILQKYYRRYIIRKKYLNYLSQRDKAVRYIQRVWRRYRMVSMLPKAWRKFKDDRI